ncbi:hypothetical protein [Longispora urticae]
MNEGDYIAYAEPGGTVQYLTFKDYKKKLEAGQLTLTQRQTAEILDKDFVARRKRETKWVDSFGRPLKNPPTIGGSTPDSPELSQATLDAAADAGVPIGVSTSDVLQPGQYVVWGEEDDPMLPGVKRRVMMLSKDANMRVVELSPQETAQLQIVLNNPVTGRPDADILKAWDDAVKLAQRFAATGQPVTVRELFLSNIRAKAESNYRSGSGGYGGGGYGGAPKAVISDSYAKAALSAGMMKIAGREPTNAEVSSFRAKLQADWDSGAQPDPSQMAIDWTRGNLGAESSSTATTNYMDSIMSLMGPAAR